MLTQLERNSLGLNTSGCCFYLFLLKNLLWQLFIPFILLWDSPLSTPHFCEKTSALVEWKGCYVSFSSWNLTSVSSCFMSLSKSFVKSGSHKDEIWIHTACIHSTNICWVPTKCETLFWENMVNKVPGIHFLEGGKRQWTSRLCISNW